jgi:hypothetical protein
VSNVVHPIWILIRKNFVRIESTQIFDLTGNNHENTEPILEPDASQMQAARDVFCRNLLNVGKILISHTRVHGVT